MTSREQRRAPRSRPPQSTSAPASTKSSGSPAPIDARMANRRKQDDQDDGSEDKPSRNKRVVKDKEVVKDKGKSKLVEEIPLIMPPLPLNNAHEEDEEGSITRCVCGSDEEDMGNFMIQCEQCSVWQHGVCMGVANVDESPEHYYCEQCKPENHANLLRELKKGRGHAKMPPPVSPIIVPHGLGNGLAGRPSRSTSPGLAKPPKSPKRRNTMNSRDAAYDEAAHALLLTIQPEPEPEPEAPTNQKRKRKRTGDVEEDDALKRKRATMSPMSTTSDRPVPVVAEAPLPLPPPPKPDPPVANRGGKRRKEKDADADGKPKHPNQYTYRSSKVPPASRRPAANDSAPYPSSSTRRTAAAAAAADRAPSPSPLPTSWSLPDHLSHLADLLPTPLPRGVAVRTGAGPELQVEKNAKIRWPGKRTTIGDMRKRVRGMLEWVARAQAEAIDRAKRVEELERARREHLREAATQAEQAPADAATRTISPAESGSSAISSLPTTGPLQSVKLPDVSGPPPPAVSTLQLLESLTRDLLGFQERFSDGGRLSERERRGRGGDMD
ncbi:hypothetical protein FS749_003830 [Ceratobasidium sp. UAMH 11750]|nr:hypothetical protein FS749_003830 [Ceratobasidium sp. UAMH 11750]